MHGQFTDQVAVVTGASSGIGTETALALARAGAKVVLAARRADRLEQLAAQIGELGSQALVVPTDVTDEQEANRLVQEVQQTFGRLDILINNAGVMLIGPVRDADTEHWRRMVDVNVLGLLYVTHATVPVMEAQGSGQIVNLSSLAGRRGQANMAVYCLTKWGVIGFSEALRQELLGSGVRVIVIEPGMVDTELQGHNTHPWARDELAAARQRVGQPLQASEVADTILYALAQPPTVAVSELLVRPARSM